MRHPRRTDIGLLLVNGLLLLHVTFAAPTPKSPFPSKDTTTVVPPLSQPELQPPLTTTASIIPNLEMNPKNESTKRPNIIRNKDTIQERTNMLTPTAGTQEPRFIGTTTENGPAVESIKTTTTSSTIDKTTDRIETEITDDENNFITEYDPKSTETIPFNTKQQDEIKSQVFSTSRSILEHLVPTTIDQNISAITESNQNYSTPNYEEPEEPIVTDGLLTKSENIAITTGSDLKHTSIQPTGYATDENTTFSANWSSSFELIDEDEKLNDTLFDVVIGDDHLSPTNLSQSNNSSTNKFLEVDSEEFFVPADIKERETTTIPSDAVRRTEPAQLTPFLTDTIPPHPSTVNQDTADTVFYISNTEVKVREVQPTTNTNQELQFFPAAYQEDVIIDIRRKNYSSWDDLPDQYSEDLIVSKQRQHNDQRHAQKPEPSNSIQTPGFIYEDSDTVRALDGEESISYMGESYIEVREFSREAIATEMPTPQHSLSNGNSDYVIIQPLQMDAVERSTVEPPIGVPVIEVLPPAMIREFTAKADETNQIVAALSDFKEQTSLVHHNNNNQDDVDDEEALGNFIVEPAVRPMYEKSVPTKRNGGSTVTNTTTAEMVNGTAAKVLDIGEDFSVLGISEPIVFKALMIIAPIIAIAVIAYAARCLYMRSQYVMDRIQEKKLDEELQHQPNAFGFRSSTKDDRRKSNLDAPRVGTSVPPLPPPNNPSTLQSCCQSTAPLHQQLQQRSANSSGSLTTLTMKNNQLIVQTEELYNIPRNTRETNITYSSNEKDSVFVVEVSRGADSMGAINEYDDCNMHPVHLGNGLGDPAVRDDVSLLHNEEFQVHQPPPESEAEHSVKSQPDCAKEVETLDSAESQVATSNLKTGLSQSNLSIASSANSNRGYAYGTQQHYTIDTAGYQSSTPTTFAPSTLVPVDDESKVEEISPAVESSKPIIRSAIYKQESIEKVTQILEEAVALNRVETIQETPVGITKDEEIQEIIPEQAEITPDPSIKHCSENGNTDDCAVTVEKIQEIIETDTIPDIPVETDLKHGNNDVSEPTEEIMPPGPELDSVVSPESVLEDGDDDVGEPTDDAIQDIIPPGPELIPDDTPKPVLENCEKIPHIIPTSPKEVPVVPVEIVLEIGTAEVCEPPDDEIVEVDPDPIPVNSVTENGNNDKIEDPEQTPVIVVPSPLTVLENGSQDVCNGKIQETIPIPVVHDPIHVGNGIVSKPMTNGIHNKEPIVAPLPDEGPFDSLVNLPEPPSLDEIKLLNEITSCENNNMDSLPPPPLDY